MDKKNWKKKTKNFRRNHKTSRPTEGVAGYQIRTILRNQNCNFKTLILQTIFNPKNKRKGNVILLADITCTRKVIIQQKRTKKKVVTVAQLVVSLTEIDLPSEPHAEILFPYTLVYFYKFTRTRKILEATSIQQGKLKSIQKTIVCFPNVAMYRASLSNMSVSLPLLTSVISPVRWHHI